MGLAGLVVLMLQSFPDLRSMITSPALPSSMMEGVSVTIVTGTGAGAQKDEEGMFVTKQALESLVKQEVEKQLEEPRNSSSMRGAPQTPRASTSTNKTSTGTTSSTKNATATKSLSSDSSFPKRNIACEFVQEKLQCEDKDDPLYAGVRGEWIYHENRTIHSGSKCCAVKGSTEPYCYQGPEADNPFNYSGRPDHPAILPGFPSGCTCKGRDMWEWHPSVTPYKDGGELVTLPFDKEQACKLLGDRRVLFFGDSTMRQAATTLMNSFLHTKCAAQMTLTLGDTLLKNTKKDRGWRWNEAILALHPKPDIVVIATGPHVHGDKTYTDIIETVTQEMLEFTREHPDIQFLFKTQQPAGCTNEPWHVDNPTLAAKTYGPNATAWEYHRSFYDRDLWLIQHIQEQRQQNDLMRKNLHLLDVRPLYSRSDAHMGSHQKRSNRDCVHFCYSGPLDMIGPLFYQHLLQLDSQKTAVPLILENE